MGPRFVIIDHDSPMLLPCDLRDWLREDHMAHFILDAVETLDLSCFNVNARGSGNLQYPPSTMLALLVYCYATGRMSSREIEAATYSDVAVRFICADTHPDHDTICAFRVTNRALFSECFVKVLALASELGHLKKVGGISVDGSKIQANASKHAAVSYKRAGEMIEQLELEVEQLIAKAESADSTPLEDGLTIPDEIVRREKRKAKLQQARAAIEARFEERRKVKQAEHQKKIKAREERRARGETVKGQDPKPPPDTPDDQDQTNFTDPESRIMKTRQGFDQCYNVQAAVDTEGSYLILGQGVTAAANDKEQLSSSVSSVPESVREVSEVLADSGYYSEAQVEAVEANDGPTVYAAVDKGKHARTVEELEKREDPKAPDKDASPTKIMRQRLRTAAGRDKYKLRKQTVEPVFGIVKEVLKFRRFHLRGIDNAILEWELVSLAYNVKRLYRMAGCSAVRKLAQKTPGIG